MHIIHVPNVVKKPLSDSVRVKRTRRRPSARCRLWLVKEDHRKEILIGQCNLALHLSILLSKRVCDGLEKNTGLNEIVQRQALFRQWIISEDDQLRKLGSHTISHLVECYKWEFLNSYNTPFTCTEWHMQGAKSDCGSPSSLAIDFGSLQWKNKCDMLRNILNWPPVECLDLTQDVDPLEKCLDPLCLLIKTSQ